MKTLFLRISALLLVFVSLGACEQETMEANPVETVPATLKDLTGLDGCGWIFELQDGTKLQFINMFWCGTPPVSQNPLQGFEFVDGKQVRIAYTVLENMGGTCMVGDIVEITKIVSLD